MTLVFVVILLLVLVGLLLVMRQQNTAKSKAKPKEQASKKTQVKRKGKKQASTSAQSDLKVQELTDKTEEWNVFSHVVNDAKVSVNDVDLLTEFNVYKQFGYYAKAAETLTTYLQDPKHITSEMVNELMDLWLKSEDVDSLSDALMQHQFSLSQEEITTCIKKGLALDNTHLGLRVLAESCLGWNVKQIAEEIGEKEVVDAPEVNTTRPTINMYAKQADDTARKIDKQVLVSGNTALGKLSNEERSALLAFMEPEKSIRFLRNELTPDTSIKYLNRAIRSSAKPASLLIDALTLDYRAKNINGFAQHLWNLYYALGQYGRKVRERMLGWGYGLGEHPVFKQLEANPNDLLVREIGIQQGYLDGGSKKKASYQSLVVEKNDAADEPRTATQQILKEVETALMYGQLDEATVLLERAIVLYPQESQFYIALFDLYERAEEWSRLERMLQSLRASDQTLPEEVVLAMSQLLQRFNNGSFGQ